jgi:predicted nucleotidyltransferase
MAIQRKVKVTSLEEIRGLIEQHRPELKRQFHVDRIGVFGSYARGNQKKKSDVDFLVSFDVPVSYFTIGGLYAYLKEITGTDVDVVPREDLRPEFLENVLQDVVYL